jgi:AcrR family transcriptional regulator
MTRSVQLPAPSRGAYDRSLSRSERDAEHRERLLLAAADVLERGPATVSKIVERAGVGRSTFYEFFDGPEHVIEHLEQRSLRGLETALDAAFQEARTPLERVRAMARSWLAEVEANPVEARVALQRRVNTELLSPAGKLFLQSLERCVHAARSVGTGAFNSADDLSLLAAAAAVEAITRRYLTGRPLREGARALADLISKLLR